MLLVFIALSFKVSAAPFHFWTPDVYDGAPTVFTSFMATVVKVAGFAENTHPCHVQAGNWLRDHRGIYRLSLFPVSDRPDLVLWALWSRNRNEEVEGIYSHHTAASATIRLLQQPRVIGLCETRPD